jgi:hypothetical protein
MTRNPQSSPGEDALNRSADAAGASPAPRRERSRRPAPAAAPTASNAVQNGRSPEPAPGSFEPSASREILIATAAYYRAQRRGFLPGHEQADWLAAEREVDGVAFDTL